MKHYIAGAAVALATLTAAPAVQAQDWTGAYAGAYIGGAYSSTELMFGAVAGYNYQVSSFVIGAEADAFVSTTPTQWEAFGKLRAGFLPAEEVMLFATAGVGTYMGTTMLYEAGVGAEVMVNENW